MQVVAGKTKNKKTLLFLPLQGTLRGKEGCRNYQMTSLCPEVIWGKCLDKGAIGEGPEEEVGFWQQYVCMGGGIPNPVHLKVPHGVGDHAHGFTQIPGWGVAA